MEGGENIRDGNGWAKEWGRRIVILILTKKTKWKIKKNDFLLSKLAEWQLYFFFFLLSDDFHSPRKMWDIFNST